MRADKLRVDESRPDFTPGGIEHVYINDVPVLEDGRYTGGRNGKVVLKPRR